MPMIESPSATTNGWRPTNGLAQSTACPRPSSWRCRVKKYCTAARSKASSAEQFLLAVLAQRLDQLGVEVEVVLDRRLAGAGDEQHALDADAGQLLDHVLDDRAAADRQHFLGLGLGGGQQARAETGDGNDGDVDGHDGERRAGEASKTAEQYSRGGLDIRACTGRLRARVATVPVALAIGPARADPASESESIRRTLYPESNMMDFRSDHLDFNLICSQGNPFKIRTERG